MPKKTVKITETERQLIESTMILAIKGNKPVGETIKSLCESHFPLMTPRQLQQLWCRLRKKGKISVYSSIGRQATRKYADSQGNDVSVEIDRIVMDTLSPQRVDNGNGPVQISSPFGANSSKEITELMYFVSLLNDPEFNKNLFIAQVGNKRLRQLLNLMQEKKIKSMEELAVMKSQLEMLALQIGDFATELNQILLEINA